MTKEEFVALQLQHQQSGKSLKKFLQEVGVCYSKYNYWNKKFKVEDQPHELAPIMFTEPKGFSSQRRILAFAAKIQTLAAKNGILATLSEEPLHHLFEFSLQWQIIRL